MSQHSSSPYVGLEKALLRPSRRSDSSNPTSNEQHRRTTAAHHSSEPATDPVGNVTDSPPMPVLHDREATIEQIRKVVKVTGKEVSFMRITPQEKQILGDIVYRYKQMGKKTTENEINRIALNYLIADYQANGDESILTSVIDALLA